MLYPGGLFRLSDQIQQGAFRPSGAAMCGQRFGAAAELPLGAERYVSPVAPAILSPAISTRRSMER